VQTRLYKLQQAFISELMVYILSHRNNLPARTHTHVEVRYESK